MPRRYRKRTYPKRAHRAATRIQRHFRRKRAASSSGMALAKKINHKGMYFHREKKFHLLRFNTTDPDTGAYVNTTTGDGFYVFNWLASDIANFTPLSTIYKRYKFTGVKIELFPNSIQGAQQQLITGWSGTNEPVPGSGDVTTTTDAVTYQPNMWNKQKVVYYKNRYVDSENWTTVAEAMESDAKSHRFNTPFKHYMVPRIQEQSSYIKYDDTTDTMDFTRSKKAWLDTSNPNITHKGCRICIESLVPDNYDFNLSPPPTLKVLTTYYITFQGQQ